MEHSKSKMITFSRSTNIEKNLHLAPTIEQVAKQQHRLEILQERTTEQEEEIEYLNTSLKLDYQ